MPHHLSFWHESQTSVNSCQTLTLLNDLELQRMLEKQCNAVIAVKWTTGQRTTLAPYYETARAVLESVCLGLTKGVATSFVRQDPGASIFCTKMRLSKIFV